MQQKLFEDYQRTLTRDKKVQHEPTKVVRDPRQVNMSLTRVKMGLSQCESNTS